MADYYNNRVVERPAGSSTQQTLPFTGLDGPLGVAVDTAGDVFVTDGFNDRVLELPAGSSTQQTVPFTGLGSEPYGVATDAARDVFVADTADQVLEMPAGSSTQESLPYVAGGSPQGIAVDAAGDVFLSAAVGGTAWELPVLTPPTVSKVTPAEDRHTAGSRSPSAAPGSHRARASRSAKATAR